jgi:Ca-activated chloride channel family protein
VVAFAGEAVRLCPLTLDRSAARLVLESLSSGTVAEPGTDLGRGLRAAARLLPPRRRGEQLILLWTDGEDLEGSARAAMEDLAREGRRVFAIGVGTRGGDVVPVLDDQGRAVDVKREESGGPVRSHLDEALLLGLARRTRGAYFSAARPGGELPRLLATLGGLTRGSGDERRSERLVERPVQRFAWFAAAAALLLAAERVRRRRRTSTAPPESAPASRAGAAGALAIAAVCLAAGLASPWTTVTARAQSDWARGDAAFRRREWTAAESLYARRARRGITPEILVNLATARARAGHADSGEEALRRAEDGAGRPGQTAAYNLGTLLAGKRSWDAALADLRRAMERDPGDEDARFNYELALRRRDEQRSRSRPPEPRPQPSAPDKGERGPAPNPNPQPGPSAPGPQTPQPPPPEIGKGLNRQQAEQLLGSLSELERLEQQRLRQVRVMRERRGRDW